MSKEVKKYEPTEKDIQLFDTILDLIQYEGKSVAQCLKDLGAYTNQFYLTKNYSESNKERYARACEQRAYLLAEQTIEIFDEVPDIITVNGIEQQNTIGMQRAKNKADSLRWYASKLNKALSDKQDNTTNIQVNGDVIQWQGAENKPINIE